MSRRRISLNKNSYPLVSELHIEYLREKDATINHYLRELRAFAYSISNLDSI